MRKTAFCLTFFFKLCFASPENVDLGYHFIDADTKAVISTQNADRDFTPASNMKLFIGVSSLKFLGNDYHYQTKLLQKTSDYYLTFSGDPSFTREDLNDLLSHLPQTIAGNFIIDNTRFDNQWLAPGITNDDLNSCYQVGVSSDIINSNCFAFRLKATRIGQAAIAQQFYLQTSKTPTISAPDATTNAMSTTTSTSTIIKIFPHYSPSLNNSVITSTKPGCKLALSSDTENHYLLSGCIAPKKNLPFSVAIRNPDLYAEQMVRDYFIEHQIDFKGTVTFAKTPKDAVIVATHDSAPFFKLLAHMLKHSDSLYANAFLKTLGNEYFHQQGSWFNGLQAIHKILVKQGFDFSTTKMYDASGGSRYDLTTPQAITQLLLIAYQDKTLWPTFRDSLSIAATDGTLEHRLPDFRGKLFAKTGTMKGTSTLSGYYISKDNKTTIFSIMINNGRQDISAYWKMEEDLLLITLN